MRRDVSILTEKETEYAKVAHYKSAEIRALRERVEHLEKQQILNTEKFAQVLALARTCARPPRD